MAFNSTTDTHDPSSTNSHSDPSPKVTSCGTVPTPYPFEVTSFLSSGEHEAVTPESEVENEQKLTGKSRFSQEIELKMTKKCIETKEKLKEMFRRWNTRLPDVGKSLLRLHLGSLQPGIGRIEERNHRNPLVKLDYVQSKVYSLMHSESQLIDKTQVQAVLTDSRYSCRFWTNYLEIPTIRATFFLMLLIIWRYEKMKIQRLLHLPEMTSGDMAVLKTALWDYYQSLCPQPSPEVEDLRRSI